LQKIEEKKTLGSLKKFSQKLEGGKKKKTATLAKTLKRDSDRLGGN
jgi:hypothetical protein